MMTSVGSERPRGTRDKAQISPTQLTQPQKPVVQATAEQIRLAQMIYDKNDVDFEDKVKQLMEVTGKNQDDCIVALHDCNGDVNRAINILLEGNSDTLEQKRMAWIPAKETGLQIVGSVAEGEDLDVAEEEEQGGFQPKAWGAWKNSIEEWTAEEWNEDLSETKVFTASSVPAENHAAPGQSIDLVTLLQKPVTSSQEAEANSFETPQQQGFGQALVFTNSQHNSQLALGTSSTSPGNSCSPQSLSSVLCSGFGELGSAKLANSTGSPILEQLKPPALGQFTSQSSLSTSSSVATTTASSWDVKPSVSQSSVLSQFDFKSQPEPSPVLSQLTQRQQQTTTTTVAAPAPPPGLESFSPQKVRESTLVENSVAPSKMLPLPRLSPESQPGLAHQAQQKQMKPPKRRIPPASKIPSSAVEMPGSADVSGLNVQFGALEFGLEPSLSEFGSPPSYENTSQTPNSIMYPTPVNDPLNTSLPMSNTVQESTYTTPAITSASLSCSSQSTSPVTTASSYDQASVHGRLTHQGCVPPSESAPAVVTNGHSSIRTQPTLDTASSVPASQTEPSPPSLPTKGSSLPSTTAATALLLPSAPPHTAALPSLPQPNDLAGSSLSQLSSSLSNHPTSLSSASALASPTSHTLATSEASAVLLPPTTFSVTSTLATSSPVSSMASTTHSLGLNVTSVSLQAPTARAAPLVSSGKAPPNLPQGVPPLLHNQYIVGPGGLLPAYPQIYGYDDLQMLQSRLPVDYYGITFPAPATLTGREGSLANNPYSGEVTKFGRGDAASPAPATTLAQAQQSQTQAHHTAQQAFLNATLPPGYSYTGLPYYAGVPGVPSAFQYGPTMFVPPASAKQHGVGLNAASTPFQQPSGYGQHSYGAGYDDLTQGAAAGDYGKGGFAGASQAQSKASGSGPGKGVSVTSSNTGVPDISGSVYNKTQTFDKQGFHTGAPPSFSLPSALGSSGALAPAAAAGYAPAPFLHILPAHQQPHSQLLHHHLPQDGQGVSGQRSQPSAMQQKSQAAKTTYGASPYWTN
ncbi:ubiquitin-associated protein 2 isoform X4 [Varanus komodoensis]|uniref:ubiquitin-associated protein 2 isoform X4 n=2 Tax=Varanus komodoensis TaxID=61221 RepID=UPI001CF79CC9|nr:ubiquitin-associated protein 2 isoform X4 [Varanus komodoensis]